MSNPDATEEAFQKAFMDAIISARAEAWDEGFAAGEEYGRDLEASRHMDDYYYMESPRSNPYNEQE